VRAGRRKPVVALLAVAVVLSTGLLGACGTSGRTLRDPAPGATAPPRKPDTTAASTTTTTGAVLDTTPTSIETTPAVDLSLTSEAWADGGAIPVAHTCQGTATSPPLTIEGVPAGTAELLLVMRDLDDSGYLQWVVAAIPPADPSFPAGSVPPGAQQLYNDGDVTSYRAPCPPAGTGRHTYELTVAALAAPAGLDPKVTSAQLTAAVDGALATATLTGTYARS
jgi:Raf kinase inhibitor-like YbhB/YbcL family protein